MKQNAKYALAKPITILIGLLQNLTFFRIQSLIICNIYSLLSIPISILVFLFKIYVCFFINSINYSSLKPNFNF